MNHVDTVLKGDTDDVVLREVGSNRGETWTNKVRLVRLVTMGAHAVLVRVNGDCGHGKLVGRTEDSDSDFSTVGDKDLLQGSAVACLLLTEAVDTGVRRFQSQHSRLKRCSGRSRSSGLGLLESKVCGP